MFSFISLEIKQTLKRLYFDYLKTKTNKSAILTNVCHF